MFKKEDTVTSLSHTTEPQVEINFDENFRMEAKIERLLFAEVSMELFKLGSQMSLTSWFLEILNSIFNIKKTF